MSKLSIVLVAVLLIAFSLFVQFYVITPDETPVPSFNMAQGPYDELIKPLSVACTPDSGYDFCYENTYSGLTARIHSTNWIGESGYGYVDGANRRYYIDEVYVNVKYYGDRLYRSSSTSWVSCTGSGCSATSISPGKQVLASAPAKVIPPVQFIAWNKFTSTSGRWWYSYVQFGWLSSTNAYVIDCYDASHCGSNEYCDKSGAWDTWSCAIDPCSTMPEPENTCDGFNLWSQKCVLGEINKDKLIETNSVTCGCVVQEPSNTCIGFDLWSQKQAVLCVEGLEKDQLLETNSIECGYVCTEGETKGFTCTDDTYITTQHCLSNEWIDIEAESCPLNWINLESILNGYLDDIKVWMDGLI